MKKYSAKNQKALYKEKTKIKLRRLLCFALTVLLIFTVEFSVSAAESADADGAIPTDIGESGMELACKSAILMEAESGAVLFEQNADEALPPASVTKVMTLLLVMEAIESGKISYTDTVRASANACSMGGSQIYLEEGEEMSVEDLVKSVVIASANDAAVALAEHIFGSEEAFVAEMNKKASELGMKNTIFENTNGLDDTVEKHLTSARDIAIMSRELIKYPKITEFSSIWMDSIRGGSFGLTNTNRLVRFYKGAIGLKTGSTAKAGFCITATAKRGGMTLIAVIMGAESRDIRNAAATKLLDYGFASYSVFTKKGESFEGIPVKRGINQTVSGASCDFSCILSKGEAGRIKSEISLPEALEAPVKKGDVIGQVIYKSGDKEIGRSDISATEDSQKLTYSTMLWLFLQKIAQFT